MGKRIDFMFFDAGGGHRSAANALNSVIRQQSRNWDVRLVNLQETMDVLDVFRKVTGIRLQDIYNRMLANGWTLGSEYLLPVMQSILRRYHPAQVRLLGEFWAREAPDMVVSLIPNFNRAMFEGFRRVSSGPFVTVFTDFADYPPHFWVEQQDQFFVCGTQKAFYQTRGMGHPAEKIFLTSGMILRPAFYEDHIVNVPEERRALGLEPDRPTGLVLFGGEGSTKMMEIAVRLQETRRDLQLIFICGRNEKLAEKLRGMSSRFPVHVVGFTQDVPRYMSLADFFVGKPGPGSISEALAMKLPVVIERNAWTLPQERYNPEWVLEKGVGIVVDNFAAIAGVVDNLLEPSVLASYREKAASINNQAVFEIPDIFEKILNGHQTA